MSRRQPITRKLPKIWMMTDPRIGDGLLAAVRKLPSGSGVVFRHYARPKEERRALFARVRRICRQRGHILLVAGEFIQGGDGVHGGAGRRHAGICTIPVHNVREIRRAIRLGADLVFLSPLYATRSHPGARPLGLSRFNSLAKLARPAKVIALGGMTRARAAMLKPHILYGWAAIDAFGTVRR